MVFLSGTFLGNYAHDSNLYSIGRELNIIEEKLRKDFKVVTDWFFENFMSLNPTKCYYMCLDKNKENDTFNFGNTSLKNSKEEVILGLTIDSKLSFDNHVTKTFVEKQLKRLVHCQKNILQNKKIFLAKDFDVLLSSSLSSL